MRKNTIILSFLTLFTAGIVSCDIEKIPETEVTDTNFWNSAADVRLVANYFYSTLPGLTQAEVQIENWSTDTYPNASSNAISDGSRTVPATSADYSYYGIYQANKLIEKAPEVIAKGASETEINRYVGEAKFFRAFYYFNMLQRFGGVPLITKTMGINDPDVFKPRATRDEVLDLIYSDLDYAISVLRTPDQTQSATEYGRITNTAAMAFKSRVALFEGTRCKFHNYGDFRKHLNLAKEAAEAVINSGAHAIYSTPSTGANGERLNPAYFNLFQEAGEGRTNRENIIVRVYGLSRENNISSVPVQRYYEGNAVVPTQNFVDHYLMADGLPTAKSPLFVAPNATMTHAQYFDKKDPRMSFSIFKRGDEFIATSGNYTIPLPTLQRSGFAIRKYAHKDFWANQQSFIDRPVLRYAEVLLNYAEALYELNGAISDAELDKTINLIRGRLPQINTGTAAAPNFVDLPKLTNAFATANGLDLRTEIRRERKVELAFEGFSYWDLIRWKTAEIELPKAILGSYLFSEYLTDPAQKWSPNTTVNENKYIVLQPSSLRRFNPAKDYLWPLPNTEIAKNPAITQNPGWQ